MPELDARGARCVGHQRIDPDGRSRSLERWIMQVGLDRRLQGPAFEDGDDGQIPVGLELRLLDGQSPVKLCL